MQSVCPRKGGQLRTGLIASGHARVALMISEVADACAATNYLPVAHSVRSVFFLVHLLIILIIEIGVTRYFAISFPYITCHCRLALELAVLLISLLAVSYKISCLSGAESGTPDPGAIAEIEVIIIMIIKNKKVIELHCPFLVQFAQWQTGRSTLLPLRVDARRGADYGGSVVQAWSSAVKALGVSLGVWWPNARSSGFARLAKRFAFFGWRSDSRFPGGSRISPLCPTKGLPIACDGWSGLRYQIALARLSSRY